MQASAGTCRTSGQMLYIILAQGGDRKVFKSLGKTLKLCSHLVWCICRGTYTYNICYSIAIQWHKSAISHTGSKKKQTFFWAALPYIKHGLYFPILCTSSYLFMLLLKDCYSECSHGKDCKICAMQATAQIPIKYNKKPSMLISMRKARRNQCGVHMLSILTFRCGNGALD